MLERPTKAFDADNHYYEADGRVHPPRRARGCEPRAMQLGRDQRQAAAARRRQGQPVHPQPDVRSGLEAGSADRLLPRQGRRSTTSPRRSASSSRSARRYREPAARVKVDGRAGARRRASCSRRWASAWRASLTARPRGAARRLPRLQPVAARGLDVQLPGPPLRGAVPDARPTPTWAVEELEFALDHGARVINMRPGPVLGPGRQPLASAIRPTTRSGPASTRPGSRWRSTPATRATASCSSSGAPIPSSRRSASRRCSSCSPCRRSPTPSRRFIADGVLHRFPNIRVATIENGAEWVAPLFGRLKKASRCAARMWPEDPRETFRRHVWVSPFYEDDLAELREHHRRRPHPVRLRLAPRRRPRRPAVLHRGPRRGRLHAGDVDKIMYANAASLVQPAALNRSGVRRR